MADDKSPTNETPKPAPDTGTEQTTKVDTEVQERAAKERAEAGGYD